MAPLIPATNCHDANKYMQFQDHLLLRSKNHSVQPHLSEKRQSRVEEDAASSFWMLCTQTHSAQKQSAPLYGTCSLRRVIPSCSLSKAQQCWGVDSVTGDEISKFLSPMCYLLAIVPALPESLLTQRSVPSTGCQGLFCIHIWNKHHSVSLARQQPSFLSSAGTIP